MKLLETRMNVLNMHTRMPFHYGIAALTSLPHLFLKVRIETCGRESWGIASEGLVPKWFDKNPDTTFEQDLQDMIEVIGAACSFAEKTERTDTVFDFWKAVHREQEKWAENRGFPALLWNFGVSMIERAIIDAYCRAHAITIADAIRENKLGIRLGEVYSELSGLCPADLLKSDPSGRMIARHTVGLRDYILDSDIPAAERVDDGLPQSLEACIRSYGLTHFKIKISGNKERDFERLQSMQRIITELAPPEFAFTLDGNEQYQNSNDFRAFWELLSADRELEPFMRHLIFVEQPIKREYALSPETTGELLAWPERPPMIIDESDGVIGALQQALNGGYVGTSHKNCKGIIKGVVNACLIEKRKRDHPDGRYVLSGEDLANIGPVALLQDLAVMAALGIPHVERNGHHYFKGLSMFPEAIQADVLAAHSDLYRKHAEGYPTLHIRAGGIEIGSLLAAPFGVGFDFDSGSFMPLSEWSYASLR
jgi:hypothetical protein